MPFAPDAKKKTVEAEMTSEIRGEVVGYTETLPKERNKLSCH